MLNSKQNEGRMARMAETFFSIQPLLYHCIEFLLKNRWLTGVIAVGVFISLPLLYQSAPRELAPVEDQSSVLTAIKSPQHANLSM